ncbi:MAG: C10 family peptidase [Kiritimatiellae bacterium]|nr:C10 family peptidase [Kiritimatiellia bacterium]
MKTLRSLAALAAALLLVPAASAAPVDADAAKTLVQGYRNYMDGQLLGGAMPAGVPDPVPLTADIDGNEATVAWVFEFEGGGWMVVSADDTMDPVPAFSHEGEVGDAFTNEASPARFFLLAKLVAQYRAANGLAVPAAPAAAPALAADAGEGPLDEDTAEALVALDAENAYAFAQEVQPAQSDRWARFRAAADPNRIEEPTAIASLADMRVPELMETKWSQSGHGENYYAPPSSAGYVPCGCTQTAMGQAIFYHKWPQSAPGQFENVSGTIYNYANGQRGSSTGVYSSSPSWNNGTTTISSGTNWITRGGDGKGGAYQWNKMYVNSSKPGYGKYEPAALGALLIDIGIINGASYKSGGTGANNYPAALMKAFHFDNIRSTKIASTHATTFSGTGASQLTNAVMCNLDAKIPCPIAGWVVSGSSGHATVMDGYGFQDGQAYFHVNFGWGGSSDGYYTWDNWGGYSTSFVYYNMFPQGTGEIVSGRTLTPDGRPIPNLAVTCTLADGSTKTVTSDSRGIWAVTRIPSETTVSFTAAATSDYTFGTKTATVGKSNQTGCQPYTQDCGNVWGVELRGIPRGAMVWGSVKNPEGQPIPGVRVVTGDGRYSATTDSLGVYSMSVAVGWSGVVKLADGQGQLGCDPAAYNVSALSAGTALERNFTTAIVLFVDCDATDGANDGTSWADAFTDLQSALGKRKPGAEIWVAEGVYKPTTGTARDIPFLMVTNVAVFGGFSGVETARSQRNWVAHRTILSGDIGVAGTKTDNSAMLVVGAPGATLDGFTITDAYQNTYLSGISSALYKYGEGVISSKTGVENSDFNFLVEHCLVTGNTCYGELLYGFGNYRSCVVAGNTTLSSYGALSYGNQLVNCTFADNTNFRQFCNSGSYSTGNYPPARFQNCYFKQTLSSTDSYYGQYYYAYPSNTDPSTLYADHNLHRTADTLSITNSTMISGAALQRADETLAGPPAAPHIPPSSSKAKDKGASQAWAANATDYLGNPRVNGTIDIGAYEITSFAAPFVALGVGDVSYHTASATLSVISLGGTATSGSAVLKYGTSPSFSGAESVSASVGIGEKVFSLSGLLAGTTYYVQVTVTGSGTTSTEILSFTTKPMTAPDVAIGTVGEPTGSSVTVDWSMSSIGKGVTKATVYVDYSTSSTFASGVQSKTVKENATGAASGTVTLTGLSSGTTYYLRVRAVNDAPLTGTSATKSVTTVDAAAPDFSFTVAPSETVTRGVVTLNVSSFGSGASSGTATIEYATKADFSDGKNATASVTRTGATAVELTRLSAGTTYYVRVTLVNGNGKSLARAAQTFQTGDPGFVAPGLMQVRYSCSGSSYPDFTVTVANNTSTYGVERTLGPIMADYGTSAVNEITGTTWEWANYTTFYYEGEMFFKGGVKYNFFHCVDDGVAIELDGEWFTRQSAGNVSGYNAGVTKASKTFETDGWHAIRIWVYDWTGGKGFVSGKIGFSGMGIGWNTNGCTDVNAANQAKWSTLRDPGDATLLRTLTTDSMPSFVTLEDDLRIAGTTLTGTIHTDGIEDGCTVTLYAGQTNAGSNTVGWARSFVAGTVPSESYDLSFQWDEFCDAGDYDGWFVIARMTNPSGTYEGWSVVRRPVAGNIFVVGIQEGGSDLTTITATPRVVGFGSGASSASVCLEYSTDANFAGARSTASVTATSTNWLSAVTISGLTPNTVYYVRTKGVKGSETAYSRKATISTKDYGTPAGGVSVGTTTLTTIPVTWSVSSLGLGNTSADVYLDYGTSSSYGQSVKVATVTASQVPKSGTYTLENLPGETTYYFRVRVVASPSGKTGTSAGASGQTRPVGNPTVSATLGAVAQYSATFSYSLAALGEGAVSASLYYDLATSSDFSGAKSSTIASGVTSVPKVGTATATGLSAETTYYLRVRAVNHAGKTGTSSTLTFTTPAVGDPEAAVDMTSVLQRAATAAISIATLGEAAQSATVTLEYGTSTAYGKSATVAGTPAAGAVLSADLSGLEPETTYYVRVTVRNDAGKTAVATTSFRTLEPNDPVFTLTVEPSKRKAVFNVEVTKIGNGAASAAGYVRWGATSALSPELGRSPLARVVDVPTTVRASAKNLAQNTTYYYEVVVTNNLTGTKSATGSFKTLSGSIAWGEGYYQGGLLQGYRTGNGQWDLTVDKSAAQSARWNSSGYTPSFAYGAVASYQTKSTSNWTNPYDGATYPMDNYNRMWAYGGQMWMQKGVTYYFAVNFFYAASISIDGEVVVSEDNGGNATPKVGSVTPTTTGWHDIAIAVGSNGNGAGAANNPWNSGSPFTSLRYGTAWNTNGLSSVTSSNASQWKQLLDAGDRHLFRARGNQEAMASLDQAPTWTSSSLSVPVSLDIEGMDGLTLKLYASRSPDAWYFEDRWEKTVSLGTVGDDDDSKTGTFTGIQVESGVDWYVSARLYNATGSYDLWTDPVKFTPQIVRQPPAGVVTVGTPTFSSNTATVNVTSLGDETGTVAVVLEYAADQAFTDPVAKTGTAVSAPGSQDFALTGLQPGRTYYVRARLTGSALHLETVTDAVSFTTPAYTAPAIASVSASASESTSATISVNVSSLGQGSASATIEVYVSTSSDFGSTPAATRTVSVTGVQTFNVTGLQAGTAYFVKVVVTGSNGLSATNTDASFVTGTVAPPSGTLRIGSVTSSSASATVAIVSLGDCSGSVAVAVEYATDAAFTSKKTVGGTAATAAGSQILALAGLAGETKYYARAVFSGTRGGQPLVGYSETVEFTTLGAQGPAATLEVTSITFDGATATVHVSSLGDDATSVSVKLEIAENAAMTGATTVGTQTTAKTGDVAFLLSELEPGKTYCLKATLTGSPSGLSSTATASFSTTAYGAPVIGSVTDTEDFHSATLAVPIVDLGAGSDSVAISVCVDVEYGCTGGETKTASLDAPGTTTLSWSDLQPGTKYYWYVKATGSNGKVSEERGDFTTPLYPLVIGEASAVAGDNGLSATMRVSLLNLASPPATVKLYLDGELVRTWSDVTEAGDFEHTATTEPNKKYSFRFVVTAGGATEEASGSFTTVAAEDWFNVRWGEDGYVAGTSWNVAGAVSKSGGSWTRPLEDESAFDGARLSLVPPEEGTSVLRFVPSKPVKAGADVTVQGSTVVSVGSATVEAPSGTRGGLVFLETGPMGWTRDGWISLKGAVPEAGETVAWKMEVALSGENAPAIRYTVGGTVLSDADGREWFSLPASVTTLGGVGFAGGGKLGDFRGFYKAQIVGKFEKPNFGAQSADGSALGFGKNAQGKDVFSVSIDNASADAVYGVYVCATVDGDYVRDKNAVVTGSGENRTFTVSTENAEAQFVVIVAAEDESQLADHLADIEGLE